MSSSTTSPTAASNAPTRWVSPLTGSRNPLFVLLHSRIARRSSTRFVRLWVRVPQPVRRDRERHRSSAVVVGQRAASILEDVLVEHPPHHVGVGARHVGCHLRILAYVEELSRRPVVAAEHRVPVIPGPNKIVVAQREVGPGIESPTFQQRREVLTFHRHRRLYPQETQHRRRYIVSRGVVVARVSCAFALRMADEKDD